MGQRDQRSKIKELALRASNKQKNRESNLPIHASKELESIMSDQMILSKFREATETRIQSESSFREAVCNLIVFMIDMTE